MLVVGGRLAKWTESWGEVGLGGGEWRYGIGETLEKIMKRKRVHEVP